VRARWCQHWLVLDESGHGRRRRRLDHTPVSVDGDDLVARTADGDKVAKKSPSSFVCLRLGRLMSMGVIAGA
jgi:hypothetical protein